MKRSKPPSPPSPPTKPSKTKWFATRTGKWLTRAVVALLLYTLVGFLLLPALIKWQLGKRLPIATHRNAAVRDVKFNPYALSLTINGLSLTETNGDPFASWEQLHVDFQLSSLFHWAWTFREIRLVEPRFNAVLEKDGRFNFANLMSETNAAPRPTNGTASTAMPRVIIYSLSVSNGRVGFSDLTLKTPFRTSYEPINFLVENFTTKHDRQSPYAFEAASDSGRGIAWSGSLGANPAASAGKLSIIGIDLSRHAPYLEATTSARVSGGTMDVAGDYRFALSSNGMDLVVSNLAVTTTGLELKDPETNENLFALARQALRGGRLDYRERRLHIDSVTIDQPAAVVRRRADGSINLLSLLVKQPAATNTATNLVIVAGTNAPAPWLSSLDDFRVERGAIVVEDLAIPGGFRTTLRPVSLRVQNYTTAVGSNAQVQAEMITEAGEKIGLEASVCLTPIRASGLAQLINIELPKYLPYAKPHFAGRLSSGKLDVSLPFEHALIGGNVHQVTLSNGLVRLRNIKAQSPDGTEKWVQAPLLALEGINLNLRNQTAEVRTLLSTNVEILARLETNGALNLLSLLVATNTAVGANGVRTGAAAEEARSAALTNQPAWRATVQEITLGNWAIHLQDRTLARPAAAEIDQLTLNLRDAQFPSNAPIGTQFSARVNRAGTVAARGTFRPYSAEVETEIAVARLELRPFQPWLDPLARLTVTSGSLNSTGKFTLAASNSPGPRIRFAGALVLTNFLATDQVLSREFARWKEIEIAGADVQLKPDQVEVQRVRINGLRTTLIMGRIKSLTSQASSTSAPPMRLSRRVGHRYRRPRPTRLATRMPSCRFTLPS